MFGKIFLIKFLNTGVNYYRSGIPVVLTSGNPGSFGFNELTVDFYLASLGWNLKLFDLKKLALNSIQYSSLSKGAKQNALLKWSNQWSKFISSSYKSVCQEKLNSSEHTEITVVLPTYSYFNLTSTVTIHGRGFESFFCKKVVCKFGEFETPGTLVLLNEVICESPVARETFTNLAVKILLFDDEDKLSKEIETSFNFTILSDPRLYELYRAHNNQNLKTEPSDEAILNVLANNSKSMNSIAYLVLFFVILFIFMDL